MMILVAGPYRSGTGDDPEKMASQGADEMVRIAHQRGLRVFNGLLEVPGCA
jgi:hypothetical protein